MIWSVVVDLKKIHEQEHSYPWPRPESCMRCRNWRVWGHGFVRRYFDGYAEALFMKCYRCPFCGCVITLRPASHFTRIRSSRRVISMHLHLRLSRGRWPPSDLTHSRLRHWLANLRRWVAAHLANGWKLGLWAGFQELLRRGHVPVARVG